MPLLALALFSFALPAAAGAERDIAEATRLLGELQEEEAVRVVTRALQRGPEPAQAAQLYVLLGMARYNLLDEEGARSALHQALDANAAVGLPARAAPKMRSFFNAARARWMLEREEKEKEKERERARLAALPPAVAPRKDVPPPPSVATEAGLGGRRVAGMVAAGAGGVSLLVGGGLSLFAQQERDLAQNAEGDALAAERRFQSAQAIHGWGNTLLVAGAAVGVAGAVLLLWPEEGADERRARLVLGPGSIGLAGRF